MSPWIAILIAVLACAAGAFGGYEYRKQGTEKKIGRTEEYAKRLYDDAVQKADEYKREKILEAKEEILKEKAAVDAEIDRDKNAAETEMRERRDKKER